MTPDQFRDSLDALDWTLRGLATLLGCDDRHVRRWASGAMPVPDSVGAWLAGLAAVHAASPPPRDWRTRRRTEAGAGA